MNTIRFMGLVMWVAVGCSGSPSNQGGPSLNGSTATTDDVADASTDLELPGDADAPADNEGGEDISLQTDPGAPGDVASPVDTMETTDVASVEDAPAEADVASVEDAPSSEDLSSPQDGGPSQDAQPSYCEYACDIDCQCKKDGSGCDIEECESEECIQLMATIAALLPSLQSCGTKEDCTLFEFPICGSLGCFQRAVDVAVDLTELSALAQQAMEAQCSGFHCGCGFLGQPDCVEGQCVLSPMDE